MKLKNVKLGAIYWFVDKERDNPKIEKGIAVSAVGERSEGIFLTHTPLDNDHTLVFIEEELPKEGLAKEQTTGNIDWDRKIDWDIALFESEKEARQYLISVYGDKLTTLQEIKNKLLEEANTEGK